MIGTDGQSDLKKCVLSERLDDNDDNNEKEEEEDDRHPYVKYKS